jgi:hypothetical protein
MKWFGIALVVLALGIGIVPHYTDCLSQGKQLTLANGSMQPMKCHWSAQGEIAVAAPILAVGVMLTTTKRKGAATGLSVMGVVLGAVAIAIPAKLIGTCSMPMHICNTTMKPALTALGSVTILGSLGSVLVARRLKD